VGACVDNEAIPRSEVISARTTFIEDGERGVVIYNFFFSVLLFLMWMFCDDIPDGRSLLVLFSVLGVLKRRRGEPFWLRDLALGKIQEDR
jgi:hypothetical protein